MLLIRRKFIYVFGTTLVLLLAVITSFSYLIFARADLLVVKTYPSAYLIDRVKSAEKQGGPIQLSAADLNAVLELSLKQAGTGKAVSLTGVYAVLDNSKLNLYALIQYKGFKFLLYSQGELVLKGDNLVFTPWSFKLGKLPLPTAFILNKLSPYSNENIQVRAGKEIQVSKNIFPFQLTALRLDGDKLEVSIQKVPASQPSPDQAVPGQGTNNSPENQAKKESLLTRTSRQLNGVLAQVKTPNEKAIIGNIQAVVNKLIQNPSYPYQPEADAVKAQYNNLPPEGKDGIKNAILDNMDTATLRQIKTMFGL